MASLIYPEEALGQRFWNQIYEKANRLFGTSEIQVNTFNKVWIIPDKATVYENNDTVLIAESHLKVMLEEDYLALMSNNKKFDNGTMELGHSVIREIILPEIEKEVNEGKNFAPLRQIYNSMILATWFKQNLKKSIFAKVYVDQNKIEGIDVKDKQVKEKIYQQYLEAFKVGVYDFIKEDYDEVKREMIPRHYFSGGVNFDAMAEKFSHTKDLALASNIRGDALNALVRLVPHETVANPFIAQRIPDDLRRDREKIKNYRQIQGYGYKTRLVPIDGMLEEIGQFAHIGFHETYKDHLDEDEKVIYIDSRYQRNETLQQRELYKIMLWDEFRISMGVGPEELRPLIRKHFDQATQLNDRINATLEQRYPIRPLYDAYLMKGGLLPSEFDINKFFPDADWNERDINFDAGPDFIIDQGDPGPLNFKNAYEVWQSARPFFNVFYNSETRNDGDEFQLYMHGLNSSTWKAIRGNGIVMGIMLLLGKEWEDKRGVRYALGDTSDYAAIEESLKEVVKYKNEGKYIFKRQGMGGDLLEIKSDWTTDHAYDDVVSMLSSFKDQNQWGGGLSDRSQRELQALIDNQNEVRQSLREHSLHLELARSLDRDMKKDWVYHPDHQLHETINYIETAINRPLSLHNTGPDPNQMNAILGYERNRILKIIQAIIKDETGQESRAETRLGDILDPVAVIRIFTTISQTFFGNSPSIAGQEQVAQMDDLGDTAPEGFSLFNPSDINFSQIKDQTLGHLVTYVHFFATETSREITGNEVPKGGYPARFRGGLAVNPQEWVTDWTTGEGVFIEHRQNPLRRGEFNERFKNLYEMVPNTDKKRAAAYFRERWSSLLARLGVSDEPGAIFDNLMERHTQDNRYHHNAIRLAEVLRHLDDLQGSIQIDDSDALELAIFFQDAVFDTNPDEARKKRILYIDEKMKPLGVSISTIERAQALFELPPTERNVPDKAGDEQLFVDLQLLELGYERHLFHWQEQGIRKEHEEHNNENFLLNRRDFIQGLLTRDPIYYHSEIQEQYEEQARENLTQRLAMIERQLELYQELREEWRALMKQFGFEDQNDQVFNSLIEANIDGFYYSKIEDTALEMNILSEAASSTDHRIDSNLFKLGLFLRIGQTSREEKLDFIQKTMSELSMEQSLINQVKKIVFLPELLVLAEDEPLDQEGPYAQLAHDLSLSVHFQSESMKQRYFKERQMRRAWQPEPLFLEGLLNLFEADQRREPQLRHPDVREKYRQRVKDRIEQWIQELTTRLIQLGIDREVKSPAPNSERVAPVLFRAPTTHSYPSDYDKTEWTIEELRKYIDALVGRFFPASTSLKISDVITTEMMRDAITAVNGLTDLTLLQRKNLIHRVLARVARESENVRDALIAIPGVISGISNLSVFNHRDIYDRIISTADAAEDIYLVHSLQHLPGAVAALDQLSYQNGQEKKEKIDSALTSFERHGYSGPHEAYQHLPAALESLSQEMPSLDTDRKLRMVKTVVKDSGNDSQTSLGFLPGVVGALSAHPKKLSDTEKETLVYELSSRVRGWSFGAFADALSAIQTSGLDWVDQREVLFHLMDVRSYPGYLYQSLNPIVGALNMMPDVKPQHIKALLIEVFPTKIDSSYGKWASEDKQLTVAVQEYMGWTPESIEMKTMGHLFKTFSVISSLLDQVKRKELEPFPHLDQNIYTNLFMLTPNQLTAFLTGLRQVCIKSNWAYPVELLPALAMVSNVPAGQRVLATITELKGKFSVAREAFELLKIERPELLQAVGIDESADIKKGGIDLNPKNLDMQKKGIGIQMDYEFDLQDLPFYEVNGFTPVIINITPIPNILPLIGIVPRKQEEEGMPYV